MMTNLFNIFDPSTTTNFTFNWLSMLAIFIFVPSVKWLVPNRHMYSLYSLIMYVVGEFKPLIKKNTQMLIMPVSLFLIIFFNNLPGLLPYVFTASSHMSVTLTTALQLWVGFTLYGWFFNTSNLLVHMIPTGTPTVLMPFMVLIETVSNIIRPLTLAIRLAANMIAGHLLITLLTSANIFMSFSQQLIMLFPQLLLTSLEVAVAMIQAYVFTVLLTLYSAESIN